MWYLYGIALLAGVANAIEPGQNATLSRMSGQPILAGIVCFALALLSFLIAMLVTGQRSLPGRATLAQVPWWAWPGGVLGAAVVLAQLYLAESLGAAPFLGLVVTGGVITSILLDHFGLVGFKTHRASRWRVLGGALMVVGVTLVALS
ncbi:MAG: DMT family transporter [Parafilimonas terrae]|nr:DMT family transporter [Parafilimonas terrae]